MNAKTEIIKLITSMAGRYSAYEIFTDWIRMAALSIQNICDQVHGKIWQEREQAYIDTARKYKDAELRYLIDLTGLLTLALEDNLEDVLGDVYMKSGMGSKAAGQFFTPFHLSELCARLSIDPERLPKTEHLELNEPSCGGGGMIIAACKVLHDAGFDYQKRLRVVAQDLDWKGVYMTYLQLSLIGCNAIVVQGNTLANPYVKGITEPGHVMRTPMNMGVLL